MTPLRLRMIEDMQIRNLAPLTQTCLSSSRFPCSPATFGQSPERLGPDGDPDLSALSDAGQTLGGQFDLGRGGRAAVLLHRHPQASMDRRGRHPDLPAAAETPRGAEPGGSRPVPGRGREPEAPRDPDRLLRGRSACFRGGPPEAQPRSTAGAWSSGWSRAKGGRTAT